MKSRTSKAVWGFISDLGGSSLFQIISLLIIPVYLDLTSQELFGLWLTIGSLLGWMSLGDMGIGMALTRRIIEALEKDDYNRIRKLIVASFVSFSIIGLSFFASGFAFVDYLISFLSINSNFVKEFKDTFLLMLFAAFIKMPISILDSPIVALQHISFSRLNNSFLDIVSLIINVVLLYVGFGIISFAIGFLIGNILKGIISFIYLNHANKKIKFYPFNTSIAEIKSLFSFGGYFQVLKIANLVSTSTDNIIITAYMGAPFVPIYVFTSKIAFFFSINFISRLPGVLFPGISQLFELKDFQKISKLYLSLIKIAVRCGLFIGVYYFCINEIFVNIWVGNQYYGGTSLTIVFVIWILIESLLRGITSIVYASSDLKILSFISILEATLNVIISLSLISIWGLVGVALGTILSRIFTTFWFVPYQISKSLKSALLDKVLFSLKEVVLYSMPSIILLLIGKFFLENNTSNIIYLTIMTLIPIIVNIFFFEGIFLIKVDKTNLKDKIISLKKFY